MTKEIKAHIMNLGKLLQYANSRDDGKWANQSSDLSRQGVYGHTLWTIQAILTEVYGPFVAIDAMNRINFGGDKSFGHDILNAIDEALAE